MNVRVTPKGKKAEYRPAKYDGTAESMLDYIAKWYPASDMSQDLPGVPTSRIPLEDAHILRSLIADGRVVVAELRGKSFLTVAG